MKVLSVDWDYFFPNINDYDWGHSEEQTLFYEAIWPIRAGCRKLFKPDEGIALDLMRVSDEYKTFWNKVLIGYPRLLIVTESHLDLWKTMKDFPVADVWNFDQHHDMYGGYDSNDRKVDCGNWAIHMIEEMDINYHLVYPSWRQFDLQYGIDTSDIDLNVSIPDIFPMKFDCVFICRSSCWTPSWNDKEWLEFIEYFKQNKKLWKNKLSADFVLSERRLDEKLARDNAKAMEVAYSAFKELRKESK